MTSIQEIAIGFPFAVNDAGSFNPRFNKSIEMGFSLVESTNSLRV